MKDQATLETSVHELVGHQHRRQVERTRVLHRHLVNRHLPAFLEGNPWALLTTLSQL